VTDRKGKRRTVASAVCDHPFVVALVVGLVGGALVYWRTVVDDEAVAFYGKNLRGYLFSGFLSLGAFMLSLKTFIVVKMKEGLFDQPIYKERHSQAVQAGGNRDMYRPLVSLRLFLLWSIISSILTATVQMTVGLLSLRWAVAMAIGCVGFTIVLLFRCLAAINSSLSLLFRYAADAREKELQEEELKREQLKQAQTDDERREQEMLAKGKLDEDAQLAELASHPT